MTKSGNEEDDQPVIAIVFPTTPALIELSFVFDMQSDSRTLVIVKSITHFFSSYSASVL